MARKYTEMLIESRTHVVPVQALGEIAEAAADAGIELKVKVKRHGWVSVSYRLEGRDNWAEMLSAAGEFQQTIDSEASKYRKEEVPE